MKNRQMGAFLLALAIGVAGCATSSKKEAPAGKSGQASEEGSRIVGNIPADSPFSKLKLGMTKGMVHELIGQPTDEMTYSTGKVWIPFYFGKDMARLEEMYKGQGRITYTGMGMGGTNYKVYRIEYDPTEDGHPDR
ncbi:MAG: hypothetical protein H6R26_753 [Proteobacteria bacterium]|nr:hypothetical protein [Pseudomonadota bacterium]